MAIGDPIYVDGDLLYDEAGDVVYESDDCCRVKLLKCSDDSDSGLTLSRGDADGHDGEVFKRAADEICYYLGDATPCVGEDAGDGEWFDDCETCIADSEPLCECPGFPPANVMLGSLTGLVACGGIQICTTDPSYSMELLDDPNADVMLVGNYSVDGLTCIFQGVVTGIRCRIYPPSDPPYILNASSLRLEIGGAAPGRGIDWHFINRDPDEGFQLGPEPKLFYSIGDNPTFDDCVVEAEDGIVGCGGTAGIVDKVTESGGFFDGTIH